MTPVRIERAALAELFAHGRATHPDECCGAVVERGGCDLVRRFTNIQNRLHAEDPVANPRDATTAYCPDGKELYEVLKEAEAPGAHLKAFYHSHTCAEGAYFSAEDRARGMFGEDPAYPHVAYLVVSDSRTREEVRAFRWDEAARGFVEVPVEIA